MHTSVVKLRPENIVDLAKDVIRPAGWRCEWNIAALQKPVQCRIVLNSWSAYLQHLINHCQQIKGTGGGLSCRLPRCNIPSGVSISSYNELVNHIQQSHLSRAQLTCPIRDCSSNFSRPALMENHFDEMHPELIGQEVSLSSPLLQPTWRPFRPDHPAEPSPLPQSVPPGSGLILPIKGTPRRAIENQESQLSQVSQWSRDDESVMGSQPQLSTPRKKRPKRQIDVAQPEEAIEEPTFVFDDLPAYNDQPETVSLIRPKEPPLDVARPQEILDPKDFGYRVYEGTILYDNFVRIHGLGSAEETEEDDEEG